MSTIRWTEADVVRTARWHSGSAAPPPREVVVADDRMSAATAHRLARRGTALLWRGDYHNARQLLRAMSRRLGHPPSPRPGDDPARAFHLHREARGRRARVLGMLLVLLEDGPAAGGPREDGPGEDRPGRGGHVLNLRRAPDVRQACAEAYGQPRGPVAVALTELLGVLGAHQWRVRGVEVPALGARIHPHYGVFSPVRGEYVDLVARAPLPPGPVPAATAFDLGTGTGVLAAVLAGRGFGRVVATDAGPRALACARDNVHRLGLAGRVTVTGPALYPGGRARLVVCNPPWLPARPVSELERGVYDADAAMLRGFLDGLTGHLEPGGEGWLILSDLAEHLGLRTRAELLARIAGAGLCVLGRIDTKPRHPRSADAADPLHAARAAETTSLWRLAPA
ncbi:methyltransferase [Nonomuraea pusilla]|uniref:Methyltransferase small domain-containing protein n=1 Tax=Nonomuraea pusilla TaxID=46177 RepID=A0A1H7IS34_9ACTN|nr:class I SAM-dependent methyltransferase [Nonomuraea pusilla]SEK65269.1 Methyltransferase small domain-containing protein [Nonomuraea pusilla]